jgi:hypothetical protein
MEGLYDCRWTMDMRRSSLKWVTNDDRDEGWTQRVDVLGIVLRS